MISDQKKIFISYSRHDSEVAQALTKHLKLLDIDTWVDYENLTMGTDFVESITNGLNSSDGVIIIASEKSIKSDWVLREIEVAARNKIPIFPIVVDDYVYLPEELLHIQAALISSDNLIPSIIKVAKDIKIWLERVRPKSIDDKFSESLAKKLAQEANQAGKVFSEGANQSVFVVHGHDDNSLFDVTNYLNEIGVNPIILKDHDEQGISLLQRFLKVAEQATFAIVIFSPDDYGTSLKQYNADKGGEKTLRYRARQNVVLELGFFLGKLKDFNKVFVLRCRPNEEWPEFEMPSDLGGAIFKDLDDQGRWKNLLRVALIKNGVEVN